MKYSSFKISKIPSCIFFGLLVLAIAFQPLPVYADGENKMMSQVEGDVEQEVTALIHATMYMKRLLEKTLIRKNFR